MKSTEFLIEHIETDDIGAYQLEECRRELLKLPHLFESTDEYSKVKDFWIQFKKTPVVGEMYLPISVSVIIPGRIMSIARTLKSGSLEEIKNDTLYFDFGKGPKPFPFDRDGEDQLQQTLLCQTEDEQEKVRMWVYMTFKDWQVKETTL